MSTPEQNKELVLTAFDTLFGKRDYAAAEEFWSEEYFQHSRHIPPGRRVCSTSFAPCPPPCATTTSSRSPRATT